MSEKMLTMEEIKSRITRSGRVVEEAVEAARQGMMPIPEAVGFDEYRRTQGDFMREHDEGVWNIAQAALLADPLVIDLRGVEWPEWAVEMLFSFIGFGGKNQAWNHIPRPTPAWRPKEGDRVWAVYDNCNAIHIVKDNWRPQICTKYAAARNLDELDWTWDQFLARGDVWEAI